ncbi:MAG TPA: DUF3570 domain-containing protein [Polyangia bacterium]|nr:DUF3570 domain-containing protein [Polyangia bacterium]
MRTALLASVVALAAGPARLAHANTAEVAARTTMFDEPSNRPGNDGVRVIHPQVDATATVSSTVNFALGYSADVVTGATPSTFDTVSAATKFSDNRHLFHGGIGYEQTDGGIAFAGAYGFERDYKSIVISGTTHHDLYEHNFTLALAYSHNFDSVCDADNTAAAGLPLDRIALPTSSGCFTSTPGFVTHKLNIDTFEPSLSWTMTPRLVIQGGATIQILDGFQSNPYRKVLVGNQNRTPQEHEPDNRQRYALFARLAYAFPELRASMLAMVRGYDDSWAVRAITGDLTGTKYVGQNLLVSGRAHYHLQSGASFYRNALEYETLGPAGQYWTGDRELSPMGNYLLGGKIAYFRRPQTERTAWFVEIELGAKYEILLYRPESPYGPNPDRKFAHIIQGAAAMRF